MNDSQRRYIDLEGGEPDERRDKIGFLRRTLIDRLPLGEESGEEGTQNFRSSDSPEKRDDLVKSCASYIKTMVSQLSVDQGLDSDKIRFILNQARKMQESRLSKSRKSVEGESIDWMRVEISLLLQPGAVKSLGELLDRGHMPILYRQDEGHYYFGTSSYAPPEETRMTVASEKAVRILLSNFDVPGYVKSAEGMAKEIGVRVMGWSGYREMGNLFPTMDEMNKVWLFDDQSVWNVDEDNSCDNPMVQVGRVMHAFGVSQREPHIRSIFSRSEDTGWRADLVVNKAP